jgi:hypothetical protein
MVQLYHFEFHYCSYQLWFQNYMNIIYLNYYAIQVYTHILFYTLMAQKSR